MRWEDEIRRKIYSWQFRKTTQCYLIWSIKLFLSPRIKVERYPLVSSRTVYVPLENRINVNKHKLLMMMLLSFETLFSMFEVLTNSLMALLGTNVCEALDRVCSECQIYQVLENTSLFSTSQVRKSINRVVMPDGSKKKLVELRGRIEMKWMKNHFNYWRPRAMMMGETSDSWVMRQ